MMGLKPRYALAVAAMLASGAAHAQEGDWRRWTISGSGDREAMVMIDPATLVTPATGFREIATLMVFRHPQARAWGTYRAMRIVYRLDCAARTYQIVGSSSWSGGVRLRKSDTVHPARPSTPGSGLTKMLDGACSGTLGDAPRIRAASPEAEAAQYFAGKGD